ncbi:MAG: TraR/DksA C4-type zinc finger protein [Candidatus Omnitrophica bacterium]|nr:TraR/DksA C4-type zinc finger protein [Candidatus Omnitrophota bacterium]
MTRKELAIFKEMLLGRKEELLNEIGRVSKENLTKSPKEASGDLSSYTFHMADMASDNYERDMSMEKVTTEHRIIYEIEEALERLGEGAFGNCESCEKKISKERLMAIPYTRFCRDCQEKEEKKKKKAV